MNILYVENHRIFARIVTKEFLSGHDVTTIPRVADAWRLVQELPFDVVLVDYDLDDGKGEDLVRRIRRAGLPIRIVAVSSRDDGNERLLQAGADTVCEKSRFRYIDEVLQSLTT